LSISERESEAYLTDALLGLADVARVRDRLHERGERRARRAQPPRRQLDERVLRVEQVEDLGDRLETRRPARPNPLLTRRFSCENGARQLQLTVFHAPMSLNVADPL